MSSQNDGIVVILSSPSGAGKTTLVKLLSKRKNFNVSISHTTRKPRESEIPEKDYFFIDDIPHSFMSVASGKWHLIETVCSTVVSEEQIVEHIL